MKNNWNFELLYKSDKDPQIEIDILQNEKDCDEFVAKYKNGEYLETPLKLLEALNDYEAFLRGSGLITKPSLYYWLLNSKDQTNELYKKELLLVGKKREELSNKIKFFTLSISKLDQVNQKEFLTFDSLKPYFHFLETLFKNGKYSVSEKEENLITLFETPANENWVQLVRELRSKASVSITLNGQSKKYSYEELGSNENSTDKSFRDESTKALYKIRKKNKSFATAEINSILHTKKVTDDLRGYIRPDQERLLDDDVDTEVIDTLISAVRSRYDIPHRYFKLKARLLGVEKLAYHEKDLLVGDIDKSFTYEEAKQIVLSTYESLDPELASLAKNFFDEDRIDVYPAIGKRGGSFCTDCGDTGILPQYILLNFNNKIDDVVTLAHELGHGVNAELVSKNQMAVYFHDSSATAEVASTFFEDFTLSKIAADFDSSTKLAFIMQKLNQEIDSIFRQIAVYQFELDLHTQFRKKLYLSTKEISALFSKYMTEYAGDAVNNDKGSEIGWVHLLHIRMFFYVYSYASGVLISKSLQEMVKADKTKIEDFKTFLKIGSSKSPKEIFAEMGINIADKQFWLKGLDSVDKLLKEAELLAEASIKH